MDFDIRYKVILLGDYGVGKSAIFRRFADDCFVSGERSSSYDDNYMKKFRLTPESEIGLWLWDTAGCERYDSLSDSYYHCANAAIVCYSLANRSTYEHVHQFINLVKTATSKALVFVCATQKDDRRRKHAAVAVSDSDMETLSRELDGEVDGMFEVSSKTGEGIAEMFDSVARLTHKREQRSGGKKKDLNIDLSRENSGNFDASRQPLENVEKECRCCLR